MPIDSTSYVLWLIAPLVQTCLLVAMYRRGLSREYPYFFNYTILQVITEPALVFLASRAQYDAFYYALYYYGYWVTTALSVVASFFVLQEIFYDAFRPFEAWRNLSVLLFWSCAVVVLLLTAMWARTSGYSDHAFPDAITLGDRSIRLVQCGMALSLLLFSEYLGISKRSVLFGIVVGFGMFAFVNMLVFTSLSSHHIFSSQVLTWINSATYDLATLVWLGYMSRARVSPGPWRQRPCYR